MTTAEIPSELEYWKQIAMDQADLLKELQEKDAASGGKAIFWFKNHPLPVFDYKTPQDLVSEKRTEALIKYLQSLRAGYTG